MSISVNLNIPQQPKRGCHFDPDVSGDMTHFGELNVKYLTNLDRDQIRFSANGIFPTCRGNKHDINDHRTK